MEMSDRFYLGIVGLVQDLPEIHLPLQIGENYVSMSLLMETWGKEIMVQNEDCLAFQWQGRPQPVQCGKFGKTITKELY
ncbi:hypothetical protein QQP08_019861 [Theobroma cacao]|nr:hypothetical protein QQP08_019861 [Theobroma cacao]